MNNFASLNMLNTGFIQFVKKEERQYNAHAFFMFLGGGGMIEDTLGVLDVFK